MLDSFAIGDSSGHYPSSTLQPVDPLLGPVERLVAFDSAFTLGLKRFCANAVLVTALLPYVSFIVIPSLDVQLMALATASAVLLVLLILSPSTLSLRRTDLYILGIGVFTFAYLDPYIPLADVDTSMRGCAPIILGFPIYFAVRNLYRYMSPRVFVGVVAFYFGALIVQLKFSAAYAAVFGHFLSDTRFNPEDGRGPNGLTPEPSMMGNMCMLFVVALYFFHREYWLRHKRAQGFVLAASILMLIITKSATGVVFALMVSLAALFASRLAFKVKAALLAGLLVAVACVGGMLGASDIRGARVLSTMAGNPLLVLQDYGLAARCTSVFVGLYQLPETPFGTGDVRPDIELTNRALDGYIATWLWPDWSLRKYLVDLIAVRSNNPGIGGLIQRMGLLALLCTATLVSFIRGFPGKWVVRIYVLGLFLNASMFISTLWLILGCCAAIEAAASQLADEEPDRLPLAEGRHYEAHHVA